MKRWVGRWLMGVAVVHTIYAPMAYGDALASIVRRGVFNTVGTDAAVAEAAWFVMCGAAFFIFGLAVDQIEKPGTVAVPGSIAWSLLVFGILGVVLMPDGGFWLFLPPAIFILVRKPDARLRGG